MISLTAQEANWYAKQRTIINGLLETVIYPKIHHTACYGQYGTSIKLEQFEICTQETITHLIGILQKNGYSAKIKNKELFIEWK